MLEQVLNQYLTARLMISLVIVQNQKKSRQSFRKSPIVIGSEQSAVADLPLILPLLPCHVIITEKEGKYLVINEANDPYVVLNNLPFGKRNLQAGDVIKIYDVEIMIEAITNEMASSEQISSHTQQEDLEHLLEKKISSKRTPFHSPIIDFESDSKEGQFKEFEEFAKEDLTKNKDLEELSREDIAALVEEVEKLEAAEIESKSLRDLSLSTPPYTHPFFTKASASSEHSIEGINVSFEEKKGPSSDFSQEEKQRFRSWLSLFWEELLSLERKKILWIIAILFFAFLVIISLVFMRFNEHNEELENQAARSVADTAMALLHAQLHQIKPQSQNWSDRDFLKDNLLAILSTKYSPLCELDNQGKFVYCPYLLRIYTSKDLTRFLIVAQPASSLMNWFASKNAVVLDSEQMELRKINDIRALNRLLLSTTTLDGTNALEVSELVQQGEIIPLSKLGEDKLYREFNPPQELAFVQSGAENLIYNAPRYYKLTEPVMELAASIAKEENSEGFETLFFLENLKNLSLIPHIVLYTTKGMEAALQAYKGLSMHAHIEGYLIGYLAFDPQNRRIANSHLLMAKSKHEDVPSESEEEQVAMSVGFFSNSEIKDDIGSDSSSLQMQTDNRMYSMWFKQIADLAASRKQVLEPISEKMADLLGQHNFQIDPNFKEHFHSLLFQYEQADLQAQAKISKALNLIYKDYSTQNPEASQRVFFSYIKAAGLEPSIENTLRIQLNTEESP